MTLLSRHTLPLIVTLTFFAPFAIAADNTAGDFAFTPLFNGQNLHGWIGGKSSWTVENGVLACKKGARGELMTAETYKDFILTFDFKLTPGANNGLALRWHFKEDRPGPGGMEIQILDNTAPKYDDLEPYQYHGSLYGFAPARRGYLKPVGQWNHQKVILDDRRLTVILNGTTILDVNLDQAAADATAKHRKVRGIDHASGHIGFLAHGDRVFFRNIRIRRLE